MNVLQSKLTGYINPSVNGDSREYLVPVKGTKYSVNCKHLRDIRHGNDQTDKDAALFCGNSFYATRVAQLMGQGCPVKHVQEMAEEGRVAYERAICMALERDELKRSIFNKYGGWKKSYLADTAKWREMIEEFRTCGFCEEAKEQELRLARELEACYGPEGERPSKFRLVDTNPHYYNCGHYPTFLVRAVESGGFETYAEAEAAALIANNKSHRAWIQFLNG